MSAARSRRNNANMSPEAPIVVYYYCSLIVVAYCSPLIISGASAAASDEPDSYSPKRISPDIITGEDANPHLYYTTTDGVGDSAGSCCGSSSTVSSVENHGRHTREIPLNVIMELNEVKNVSQLFAQFMPDEDVYEAQSRVATTGFQTRSTLNVERKAALIPKPASCSVENKTVSLKDSDDPSLYYYPSCTRVNRCWGCCSHNLLECKSTKFETLQFEVMVSQYINNKLKYLGKKLVSVNQDVACKCGCIVQPKDCNHLQVYLTKECRCDCINEEDRQKCNENGNVKKLWSNSTCACQCVEQQDCTTGFVFDHDTCNCEPIRMRMKNTDYEFNRNVYSLGET